jgi:SAM-dependent methyltransferase
MDTWKYYAITHADHVLCNPTSVERLDEVISLLDLPPGANAWEAASGKGELLVRLAERYEVRAVGVDLSPYEIVAARARAAARVPGSDVRFMEGDAAEHEPEPGSVNLAICLGASWIWGGHRGTLRALGRAVRQGGLVLVGEPYWLREPEAEYLASAELAPGSFATLAGNVDIAAGEGLTLLYAMPSRLDEWDRYEFFQLRAAERYALVHPDDPDVVELLARARREREEYLRWGRDTLGWAIYLFRSA